MCACVGVCVGVGVGVGGGGCYWSIYILLMILIWWLRAVAYLSVSRWLFLLCGDSFLQLQLFSPLYLCSLGSIKIHDH